jgi:hypothetical protein
MTRLRVAEKGCMSPTPRRTDVTNKTSYLQMRVPYTIIRKRFCQSDPKILFVIPRRSLLSSIRCHAWYFQGAKNQTGVSWMGMLDSYKRLNEGCKAFNASEKLSSIMLSCIDCIGRPKGFGRIPGGRKINFQCGEHARRRCQRRRQIGTRSHFSSFVTNPAILCRRLANSPPSAK